MTRLILLQFIVSLLVWLPWSSLAAQECEVGDDGTCSNVPPDQKCKDGHEFCDSWAESGECAQNPKYMLQHCKNACKTCGIEEAALLSLIKKRLEAIGQTLEETEQKEKDEEETEPDLTETPWGVEQEVVEKMKDEIVANIKNTTAYMTEQILIDPKFQKVRDECKNRHKHCALWAVSGECEKNPKYMTLQCAPSCQTCDMIDFDLRCPLDNSAPNILNPGDLNKLFVRLTTDEYYKQFSPTVLSMPNPTSDKQNVQDGPWVVTLDNLLTEKECDRLVELGTERGYEISRDVGKKKFDGSYDVFQNDRRTSTNTWCNDECMKDELAQNVISKISNVTGVPGSHSEYLQLLKYEVGQFYRQHHDYIAHHTQRQQGVRILTVFLYLNDVEEGGGTDFPKLGLTVMPKKGKALIWPNVWNKYPNAKDPRTDHQALDVLKGIKYGANAWLHQRNYQEVFKRRCH